MDKFRTDFLKRIFPNKNKLPRATVLDNPNPLKEGLLSLIDKKREVPMFASEKVVSETTYIFYSFGFNTVTSQLQKDIKLEGKEYNFVIPKGTVVTRADFIPFSLLNNQHTKNTEVLSAAYVGMFDFIRFLETAKTTDDKKLVKPKYINGYTNLPMARFAQTLGFKILSPEGDDMGGTNIVGELADIHNRMLELSARGTVKKLSERLNRIVNDPDEPESNE